MAWNSSVITECPDHALSLRYFSVLSDAGLKHFCSMYFVLQIILTNAYQILHFLHLLLYCSPFIWMNIPLCAVTLKKSWLVVRALHFFTSNLSILDFLFSFLKTQPQTQQKAGAIITLFKIWEAIYNNLLNFSCSAFSQTNFIDHYNGTDFFWCLCRESFLLVRKNIIMP